MGTNRVEGRYSCNTSQNPAFQFCVQYCLGFISNIVLSLLLASSMCCLSISTWWAEHLLMTGDRGMLPHQIKRFELTKLQLNSLVYTESSIITYKAPTISLPSHFENDFWFLNSLSKVDCFWLLVRNCNAMWALSMFPVLNNLNLAVVWLCLFPVSFLQVYWGGSWLIFLEQLQELPLMTHNTLITKKRSLPTALQNLLLK